LEPISYPKLFRIFGRKLSNVEGRYCSKLEMDIVVKNNEVQGIVTQNGDTILANVDFGHSA
jgi:hypothetical protein